MPVYASNRGSWESLWVLRRQRGRQEWAVPSLCNVCFWYPSHVGGQVPSLPLPNTRSRQSASCVCKPLVPFSPSRPSFTHLTREASSRYSHSKGQRSDRGGTFQVGVGVAGVQLLITGKVAPLPCFSTYTSHLLPAGHGLGSRIEGVT